MTLTQALKYFKSQKFTSGGVWEFDWYLDLFFVEALSFTSNPVFLGYDQPVLGDDFLNPPTKFKIISSFSNFFSNTKQVSELIKKQLQILDSAIHQVSDSKKDLNSFDSSQYKKVQIELSQLMASVSVIFDNLIEKEIQEISQNNNVSSDLLNDYFNAKTAVTKLNESNQKLLAVTNSLDSQATKLKFSQLPASVKSALKLHAQFYGWLNTGLRGRKPWTAREFYNQAQNLTKKPPVSVSLSPKIQSLLNPLIAICNNDNQAADLQVELCYYFQKYLKLKLGKFYQPSVVNYLSYDEILLIVTKPHSISKYQSRANNLKRLALPHNGKIHCFYFKTTPEFNRFKSLVCELILSSEIIGLCACPGVVEAQVKLIKSTKDLKDFKKGQIMVAVHTQPSFVAQMSQAAAIVTDIGGITSHAAILSREFNIPCVVGTQNATKLLKDGDLIQVNATTGFVTKL